MLPVGGIDMILGNDSCIWSNVSPALIVTLSPLGPEQPDESAVRFPEVFPTCAVTLAMRWAGSEKARGEVDSTLSCLPDFPLSVSHSELQSEQRVDPSLETLSVLSAGQVKKNVASGYFLQDGILVRKWSTHGEDFVGDPIF